MSEKYMSQGATTLEKPYTIVKGGIQFRNNPLQLTFDGYIPVDTAIAICSALNDAFVKGFQDGASVVIEAKSIKEDVWGKPPTQDVALSDLSEPQKKSKHKRIDFFHAHTITEKLTKKST